MLVCNTKQMVISIKQSLYSTAFSITLPKRKPSIQYDGVAMALFRLEDLLAPRSESSQVLDLSSARPRTLQDFEKLLTRVPEFKIKPDKVSTEDVSINDFEFTFSLVERNLRRRKALGYQEPPNQARTLSFHAFYNNPVPVSMQAIRILDLATVQINWRMLTLARPSTKPEEDYFTKLVELEKLRLSTRCNDKESTRRYVRGTKSNSDILLPFAKKLTRSNRAGVLETRLHTCINCGIELCSVIECSKYTYDQSVRHPFEQQDAVENDKVEGETTEDDAAAIDKGDNENIKSMKARANKLKEAKRNAASNRIIRNRTKTSLA